MKARISANGRLSIIPENETESWALKCWFASYHEELPADKPVLHVELIEPTDVTERTVSNK